MILSWGRAVKINSAPFVLPPSKTKGALPSTSPYSNSVIPNSLRDMIQTNNIISSSNNNNNVAINSDNDNNVTVSKNIENDSVVTSSSSPSSFSSSSSSSSVVGINSIIPVQGTYVIESK